MWVTLSSSLAIITILAILQLSHAYLDISLQVKRTPTYISYLMPIKINNVDYTLTTSLQDSQNYVTPLHDKVKETKKTKKHKSKDKNQEDSNQVKGVIMASSLEGYSFQGWKRFFMEAFLYIESRYYHEVTIDLSQLQKKKKSPLEVSEPEKQQGQSKQENKKEQKHKNKKQQQQYTIDGLISFGPDLANNKIYQLIKANNEFVSKDIISIYRGVNDKNVRLQLGGFEESFARGHRNGILFYQMDIYDKAGKWWIPIRAISCMRQRNGKDQIFYIANSQVNLSISLQSPLLRLPFHYSSQLQRNFQTLHTTCSITPQNRLSCINMTSIDLALNFIQFQIDSGAFINISLYDLKQSYNDKTGQTLFAIQFVPQLNELQLGQALFKAYYVSVDMKDKKMYFSPINRFPSQSYGVYVIRFFVGFVIFMVVTAIGAMIWQVCSDPYHKNKIRYGQEGIQLVSYQRAGNFPSQQL